LPPPSCQWPQAQLARTRARPRRRASATPDLATASAAAAAAALQLQLDVLAARLRLSASRGQVWPTASTTCPDLPRVYGWLATPAGRRRIKCLLYAGAWHCFLSRALAAQLLGACRRRRPRPRGHPSSVQQADGSSRPKSGAVEARLVLGGLDEETALVEFNVDCDADIILATDSLATTGCGRTTSPSSTRRTRVACANLERGCTSGRRMRLDLTLAGSSSTASRLTAIEAGALLGSAGFGPVTVDVQGRPSRRCPLGRPPVSRRRAGRGGGGP
jgi:hypothetical protein